MSLGAQFTSWFPRLQGIYLPFGLPLGKHHRCDKILSQSPNPNHPTYIVAYNLPRSLYKHLIYASSNELRLPPAIDRACFTLVLTIELSPKAIYHFRLAREDDLRGLCSMATRFRVEVTLGHYEVHA